MPQADQIVYCDKDVAMGSIILCCCEDWGGTQSSVKQESEKDTRWNGGSCTFVSTLQISYGIYFAN